MQIWSYIFNHNFSGTVIGSFIFFASIVTILFSIALGIVYKTKFNMEYLGWCMLMGSVWMIGESKNAADPCSKCIWTCNFMFYYAHVMSVADFLICQ